MPIYKVYSKGVQERRTEQMLARWRWVAVAVSAILLSTAVAMMLLTKH